MTNRGPHPRSRCKGHIAIRLSLERLERVNHRHLVE